MGIVGPYWSVRDNVLRVAQKASRVVGSTSGVDWIDRRRIVIPREEENKLYSSAKICLKCHEREADGSQPHLIVNQRVFKIAACGGFQVCDAVPPIRKYFAEGEIVLADPNQPDEWFRKIDYYLTHDDERTRIQAKGTARALREHTYHNRVTMLLGLYTGQVISATNARADRG